jgi:hypothetical protein
VPMDRLLAAVRALLAAALPAGLRIATRAVPLAAVHENWADRGARPRVVFTMG